MVTSQTRGNNFQTMVKKLKLVPDTEVINPTEQNNPGQTLIYLVPEMKVKIISNQNYDF